MRSHDGGIDDIVRVPEAAAGAGGGGGIDANDGDGEADAGKPPFAPLLPWLVLSGLITIKGLRSVDITAEVRRAAGSAGAGLAHTRKVARALRCMAPRAARAARPSRADGRRCV